MSDTAQTLTPQHVAALRWSRELARCEASFEYLAKTYLRIKSKDVIGFPTLRFNPAQRILHQAAEDQLKRRGYIRLIIGKPRQIGSSTLWQSRTFHQTAFRPNRNAIMVAHDEPSSVELFSITKGFYDALPAELKPRTRYDAKQRIIFEGRNSKILSWHAANTNIGAGQMFHIVHLTEAARFRTPESLQASLFPAISNARGDDYSMVVIESTSVFGGDWFKELAEQARAGQNEFEFLFIPWYLHHAYTAPTPKDFELVGDERDLKRQYGLTDGQIAWRRMEIAKYRANPMLWCQEFPWSWESSWVMPKGSLRVFPDDVLDGLRRGLRPPEMRANPTSSGLEASLGGLVEVWQSPQPDVFYDMGVDIAEGASDRADWTVACVTRRDTLEQVAQLRIHMNPASHEFVDLIYWLGMNYHAAQVCPDITGGWGNALMTELQARSYPNLWRWRRRDDAHQRVSSRVGFLYTRREKATLVSTGVALATRGDVIIHSEALFDELATFLNIGLDEWAAAPGAHDDCVNAWMLALLAARDERIDMKPYEEPPVVPTRRPWSVHDIDADLLGDTADAAAVRMQPWTG